MNQVLSHCCSLIDHSDMTSAVTVFTFKLSNISNDQIEWPECVSEIPWDRDIGGQKISVTCSVVRRMNRTGFL